MTDPSFQTEGTYTPDGLIAGDFPRHEEEITVKNGENLTRGTVVARETASGDWVTVDSGSADAGTQVARGVLAEDVDASAAAKDGVMYRTGVFAEDEVTFGGADTVATHRDAAAEKGIFFKPATA